MRLPALLCMLLLQSSKCRYVSVSARKTIRATLNALFYKTCRLRSVREAVRSWMMRAAPNLNFEELSRTRKTSPSRRWGQHSRGRLHLCREALRHFTCKNEHSRIFIGAVIRIKTVTEECFVPLLFTPRWRDRERLCKIEYVQNFYSLEVSSLLLVTVYLLSSQGLNKAAALHISN